MHEGSWIRKMFEESISLKQQYGDENVFDLSLGNPVTEPPDKFFTELNSIVQQQGKGMHRYMPNAGYTDTRTAVGTELTKETGLNFTAEQIIMTCGAGGALNVVFKSLLDPGDEVVIFAPYFVEYLFYADNHGGSCKVIPPDENFIPNYSAFERTISPKTKIVLINSPNNPTGVVYSSIVIKTLVDIIQRKESEYGIQITLLSDEPYRKILFDKIEYPHIFGHHPRSIVATSHSKDIAIPGERIGFIAISPEFDDMENLVNALIFCNRTLGFVSAPALMQRVVKKLQSLAVDVKHYQNQRDMMYKILTDIGYSVIKPQGAFYMFPKSPVEDDLLFVDELRKQRVLVVPGRGFGVSGHFRIAYCVKTQTLERSMEGFRTAFNKYIG